MNVLVLKPGRRNLEYALSSRGECVLASKVVSYAELDGGFAGLGAVLDEASRACDEGGVSTGIDAIAIRATYGGSAFRGSEIVTADVVRRLEALVGQAPLHVPAAVELIRGCGRVASGVPIVLTFETAFFADLPPREHLYAIDGSAMTSLGPRRYGYHGLFHEAAWRSVARDGHRASASGGRRVLSVCLEPQCEVAAILGGRAMMVTSGATPLEGIPGETTCGQIDPNIALILARLKGWGPEQINMMLTQQSGLIGLLGRPTRLPEIFESSGDEDLRLARDIIQYRILQACGAGIAAIGGVDAIVFSGRYVALGEVLGAWLRSKMVFRGHGEREAFALWHMTEPLDKIIADTAAARLLVSRSEASAG
ncbi:MAG: acetate/propionate family kinase [Phycisphaerae bacterium]|nr:acetate/propionate family kinase [Phycisphaerae bacterium]